jgi:Fe2+ transport system protein FeoA
MGLPSLRLPSYNQVCENVSQLTDRMHNLIPLNLLPIGSMAKVVYIDGDNVAAHRLRELGFCDGANVEMVQTGSSCIVKVNDHKLAFRSDDAMNVYVAESSSTETVE